MQQDYPGYFVSVTQEIPETFEDAAAQLSEEVNKMSEQTRIFMDWFKEQIPGIIMYIFMIVVAIICFFVGRKLIKGIVKIVNRSFTRSNMDIGVRKFLISVIKITLNIMLVIIIAGFLGLEKTSLAALVGSAGLAIGLSLQGSLANFAGGVLILLQKPFTIGDYIISEGCEGTVTNIDIFYTRMVTVDNKLIVIPNGTLSNATITNVTNEPARRVDLLIGIEYSESIDRVRTIFMELAQAEERIIKDHPIDIFVDSFAASSVTMGFRMWTAKEVYWNVKWDMLEKIKREFDKQGIAIPFDQLDVNVKDLDKYVSFSSKT